MPTYGCFKMGVVEPTLEQLVSAATSRREELDGARKTGGCFTVDVVEPARTWTADYIVSKGDQIQFWNRCSADEKSDTLVGSARMEKGHTICDVALTNGTEAKTDGLAKANHEARERASAASM